jgi:hypothetical protein
MIKIVLAVSKPGKSMPVTTHNEIRQYRFTVIQTGTDHAAVMVEGDSTGKKKQDR